MKSSIYISAEQIQATGYAGGTIKSFVTYPLPEGTMYNGTIIDGVFLTECLARMKQSYPEVFKSGVTLIVDGSSILSRRLTTPKLSNKQYLQLVRDDFADSTDDPRDLVCGYRKLDSAQNAIFACAVNKAQIDSYISTFKDAGIRLDGIHMGAEVILNYVKAKPELQESTVVLNIIDGFTMLSMLFERGKNIFMSRTRLYGESREQIFQNVLENLNGLIQFTQSQKFDEITTSYYLGVGEADLGLLEAFNPHTDIKLGTLPIYQGKGELPAYSHFACLNMLYGNGAIDLIAARKALDKYVKSKRPKKIWIPLLVAFIIVLAAPTVYLWLELGKINGKIDEINAYLNSPAIMQKQEEITALSREISFYDGIERQITDKFEWENGMPEATSRMLDHIILGHGMPVAVVNFDFNERTGVVRVTATCADATVSADYVDALINSGVARSVYYQGYGSGPQDTFTFTIDITLNVEGAQ